MKCRFCNAGGISTDANFCPHCGASLRVHYDEENIIFTHNGVDFELVKVSDQTIIDTYGMHSLHQLADFYILKKPVTYAQWWAVMGGHENPSYVDEIPQDDITNLSDDEMIAYDLINRFDDDISDDNIDCEINIMKKHPSFFRQYIAYLRDYYTKDTEEMPEEWMYVTGITYEQCENFCLKLNELNLPINKQPNECYGVPHYAELLFAHNSGKLGTDDFDLLEWSSTDIDSSFNPSSCCSGPLTVLGLEYWTRLMENDNNSVDAEEIIRIASEYEQENEVFFTNRVNLLREYAFKKTKRDVVRHLSEKEVIIYDGKHEMCCPKDCSHDLVGFRVSLGPVIILPPSMFEDKN